MLKVIVGGAEGPGIKMSGDRQTPAGYALNRTGRGTRFAATRLESAALPMLDLWNERVGSLEPWLLYPDH